MPGALFVLAICFSSTALRGEDAKDAEPYIGPARSEAAGAEKAALSGGGPLRVTVQGAILSALFHNRDLRVEILAPAITRTGESTERAAFDPVVGGTVSYERERDRTAAANQGRFTAGTTAEVFVEESLPTGTTIRAEGSAGSEHSTAYADNFATARAGVTVTQALLRGLPIQANLARLHQARIETRISGYELRAFVETLVAEVEKNYWDYALSESQAAIVEESIRVAQQQLSETNERVKVGKISEAELAAAQAEVARRREELIDANSTRDKARLALLRLMNPPGSGLWERKVSLVDRLALPAERLDPVESHVKVALRMRPDLNQARLGVRQGNLELVRTKNGLLPKLDFFLTLGATGYAQSFGRAAQKVGGHHYDIAGGLTLEYPLSNRDARATHRRAVLNRRQLLRAVANLSQLVELDVRTGYIEVIRTREQVTATAATRRLREESLRAETEKFKVGKSTSFLVAQAQRDLLAGRLNEVEAVVGRLKALVELYRLEGSLLERRALAAPGRESVMLDGVKVEK